MRPELNVLLWWMLFGGTHLFLSLTPIRTKLVAWFGETKFIVLYVIVASVTFALLVYFYATYKAEAAAPIAAIGPIMSTLGTAFIVLGLVLMSFCIVEYVHSPMAPFSSAIASPTGMTRITRHPFLFGNVLFFGAHLGMARSLLDGVFFAGFVVLALVGAIHQDRKLLKRKGNAYAAFLRQTSLVPFAAVLSGRQQIVWSEINPIPFVIGCAAALALRGVHDPILANGGLWFIIAMIGVGAVETGLSIRAHGPREPKRAIEMGQD